MNRAIWCSFEDSSPSERESIVKLIDSKNKIIETDTVWRRISMSFTHSKEWNSFSKNFLIKNKTCIRCNEKAEQTHHKNPLSKTAIKEGFLASLNNENNFEPICKKCHAEEHEGLIKERGEWIKDKIKKKSKRT